MMWRNVNWKEDIVGSYRGRTVRNKVKYELDDIQGNKELGEFQIIWLAK